MNLKTVWDIIHAVLKKESRGNIIKPEDFTDLLQQAHLEYYNQQYEKWAASQTMIDSLKPFLVHDEAITFTAGEESLSDLAHTYKHASSARVTTNNYPIDIVSSHLWGQWMGDPVMTGTTTAPIVTSDSQNLYIYPSVVSDVLLSYVVELDDVKYDHGTADGDTTNKLVDSSQNFNSTVEVGMTAYNTTDGTSGSVTAVDSDTTLSFSTDLFPDGDEDYFIVQDDGVTDYYLPFFDYYIDANDTVQYMTNGTAYTLTASETYRDGTAGDGATKFIGVSHELKWGNHDISNIISIILRSLGVALQSPDVAQYAMSLEQKQNVA